MMNRRLGETVKVERVTERIRTYKDLRVYQNAVESAMKIFEIKKVFL